MECDSTSASTLVMDIESVLGTEGLCLEILHHTVKLLKTVEQCCTVI